jgi:glycosyltransferase involved in cell wall biosynthesis
MLKSHLLSRACRLPIDLYRPNFNPRGGYLAFLGRISPEKGVNRAIEIAENLGIPLKIAAKVDRVDEAYFREQIAPFARSAWRGVPRSACQF